MCTDTGSFCLLDFESREEYHGGSFYEVMSEWEEASPGDEYIDFTATSYLSRREFLERATEDHSILDAASDRYLYSLNVLLYRSAEYALLFSFPHIQGRIEGPESYQVWCIESGTQVLESRSMRGCRAFFPDLYPELEAQ
jgi:hypothetical protein